MDKQTKKQKHKQISNKGFMHYAGMGLQLLALIAFFTFLGVLADRQLNWKFPIFTILFSLGGVLGGMFSIIRRL